jgi:carboxyl-terminal processing protease
MHMTGYLSRSRVSGMVAGLLIVASLGFRALAVDAPAPAAPAVSPPLVELSKHAWDLAQDGKLGDVWQQIKKLPEDNPAVASLQHEVDSHETHVRDRDAKTLALYNKKLEKMRKFAAADNLRKALTAGVEAYTLAADPRAFLDDAEVKAIVEKADKQAEGCEAAGQWIKALTLYRNLGLLYELSDNRYKEQLKRVGKRVGLLRLYAPEVLFDLYKQEAAELGEDAPEPWNFADDKWEKELIGVNAVMLSESLALAARQHVEDCNFEQLLLGAIDQMETFFEAKGLEKTFPNLANAEKVKPMTDALAEFRKDIAARKDHMGFGEANAIVTKILDKNKATVDLPDAVVVHELGDGATGTLDDFSTVIWPHQKARFERTTRGSFSGVGIQISLVNRQLTVVTPIEDSPAQAAGIRSGEKITSIDGKSTIGIDLDSAVDKITGAEGTKVTLGILTPGDDKPRDVELTRSSIKIVSIKGWERQGNGWNFYIDPALKIGYLRMTTFGPNTADELDAAVNQMIGAKGCQGLILDLRFNPGGRLDAAVAVVSRFINNGVIVSTTQKTLTGQPWRAMADSSHTFPDFPLIVMVNKGSASASEIVSGALQDHKRALIVGENSFGKGSVQNLFRLDEDKAYLKLTTQYYRLPNGEIIHRRPGATKWGVAPDVTVKMTDQQVAEGIEARMFLDIVHDDKFDPNALISKPKPRKDDDDQPIEKAPPVKTAEEILSRGMDTQLETALILLKTRILGEGRG